MKRVKLTVAYDGTAYCGWQLQPNGVTIEEVLNRCLFELLSEPIQVIGASRTDSGVHALGNVAVFDTESRIPAEKICFALNQRLPEDIRIQKSEEVPLDFHPRKQNCIKTYEYRILNRKMEVPTQRLYAQFCYFPLDEKKMQEAANYLLGEHDFQSFCSARHQAEDTVRTLYSLTVQRDAEDCIHIKISGNGFLYNMVRIIAGTLMKVGMGVYAPEHVKEILEARDRQKAGPKAAAKGLTLLGLEYEKELAAEIVSENANWSYLLIQREIVPQGRAYLLIERCKENDFERLLQRVVHQAARNGAKEIWVLDATQRVQEGSVYGYYPMEKVAVESKQMELAWELLSLYKQQSEVDSWKRRGLSWFLTKNTIPEMR
ncbi:MAG: tRNA pseudouridine(38-40) synthase TruA [bacterium]|nr:tRNA pseudouridine(38-40) synthase TruA [bacterium]